MLTMRNDAPLCPFGHVLVDRDQICALCQSTYAIWPKEGSDVVARIFQASCAQEAAQQCAREDWLAGATSWPITYWARHGITGTIWSVVVTLATQPWFVVTSLIRSEIPPTTHILWGGHVLCGDLRLRNVPGDWPEGQRWISLKDVVDGHVTDFQERFALPDRCKACWDKSPDLVARIRQNGSDR